ncbi:Uncharacterised protein [Vibrio cholerae]|nr:Uncharacterised protein [Vibrio cholerae]CRZ76069.1 Uncharacterised protein [Vibrio cholerae]CRZ77677.1 Uncharacterised protein [Vibrio cholerae]CRZ81031.1 Uncharacterised protein [Vibrio cholerae]CSA14354.1 Uncharacterised protein [Vibrio cholerae]
MLEVSDDLFYGFFHAIKIFESFITSNHSVGKNTAKARVFGCINHLGFADSQQQALRGIGISTFVFFTQSQKVLNGQLFILGGFIACLKVFKNTHSCFPFENVMTTYNRCIQIPNNLSLVCNLLFCLKIMVLFQNRDFE